MNILLRRPRLFLFVLGIGCFAVLAGAVYQSKRTAADLRTFPPPGRRISVNGLNLHLYCTGSGFPTLVLEAGLGESSLSWQTVQSSLAQNMRVCSYDRPGLGWSDLVDSPIQPKEVAENLHALLITAGIPPPYVLAGHSRGGIYVRAFYHAFPEETQALVLVDSTHEQGPMHQYPLAAWDYRKQAVFVALVKPLARIGLVRLTGLANADRGRSALPAEALAAKTAVQNRTDTAYAAANEIVAMRRGLDPSTPSPDSLGKLPLLVLTAGNRIDLDVVEREAKRSGKNVDAERELARVQKAEQEELARLSSHSLHIIVRNSGHFIMQDQPEEFVRAVSEFLRLSVKSVRD